LDLNGGAIKDQAGNNAALLLAIQGSSGSLSVSKNFVIDGIVPMPVRTTSPKSIYQVSKFGFSKSADHLSQVRQEYGDNATVAEWDTIKSDFGGSVASITAFMNAAGINRQRSPSQDNYFVTKSGQNFWNGDRRYFVTRHNGTPDGTYLYHDHIQNHQLGLGSYTYDSQALAKIQGTGDGSFNDSDNITLAIEFDEQVIVNGTPRLKLETGQNDRYAIYIFGSGSNTLIFSYIVQSGDVSEDLDYQSKNALELNGGTIKDLVGNSANLILPATGAENSLAQIQSILVNYTSSSTSTSLLGGNIQGRALNLTNEISTIATGTAGHGLTTDGTYLYACASPVKKILISNPSQVSTLSGASCTYDLTTDGTYLYILEGPWGPVTKMSVNGGSKSTVYSGSFSDSNGVTTDGSYLYIFDGGHVKKINLSTNQLVTNLQHSGSRGLRGTIVGETLYISGTNIRKITTSGTGFANLINGYSEGLGTDGTYIYYADGSTLKRYTIAGGAISTLKSGIGSLRGIVTDGTHLYVTVTGGEIKKIFGEL